MKLNIRALTLATALVLALPSAVWATPNTKVDLIEDQSPGGVEVLDMAGPTGFGFINFNQDAKGNLRITVSLKNAAPNTEYSGVFVVGGSTHASATGYIDVGNLTTNGQGNGNATMIIPVETLQALPLGSGARTDHFDLMKDVGDLSAGVYTATGLDYLVP